MDRRREMKEREEWEGEEKGGEEMLFIILVRKEKKEKM